MQGNTSTPWWAAARLITASILASYARLPLTLNPAARTLVQAQKHVEPAQAAAAPNAIFGATAMGKFRAIASTLGNVLLAVAEEIGRHRRRDRNFRHLSRRQEQLPVFTSRVRFLHMAEQPVSPGTRPAGSRLPWRATSLRPVRVSFFR